MNALIAALPALLIAAHSAPLLAQAATAPSGTAAPAAKPAAAPSAKPTAKPPAKSAAKASTRKPTRKLAPGAQKAVEEATPIDDDPDVTLSEADVEVARRVHVGEVKCELGASVKLTPGRREGMFVVTTRGHRFLMHPVESRTGAIRLEDPRRGAMWLQLANKSMLMSQKLGQRLADECQSPQQVTYAEELKRNPLPSILEPLPPPPAASVPAEVPAPAPSEAASPASPPVAATQSSQTPPPATTPAAEPAPASATPTTPAPPSTPASDAAPAPTAAQ